MTAIGANAYETTYSYDLNNRLTQTQKTQNGTAELKNYFYDNNGNQTFAQNIVRTQDGTESAEMTLSPTADASKLEMYHYDLFNQLTSVMNGSSVAGYQYNADGLRTKKTVNGTTTGFVWNGTNMAAETNTDNAVIKTYGYGIDGILYNSKNGVNQYYIKDVHGNVLQRTNGSSVGSSYTYDAFGNTQSNVYEDDPFGYCGEYTDKETGNVYLRARYYAPESGRFLSEDPIKDGMNWYSYCGNNPVNRTDSSGLSYEEVESALKVLYNAKQMMNNSSPDSLYYKQALKAAQDAKQVILKSDIYIEDWGGLTNILEPIVNGSNNSSQSIAAAHAATKSAHLNSDNRNRTDNIIFVAGLTAVIIPLVKLGTAAVATALSSSDTINFAKTAADHMKNPDRYVPISILQEAIKHGEARPDPQGSKAVMYYITMYRQNKEYILEVLYDAATKTIYHFKYYNK